jgi:integral membrane protein
VTPPASARALPRPLRLALLRYRVMANIVGVLLIVLILIGVPLANFDGTPMWGIFGSTPAIWTDGTRAHAVGEFITTVLGIAHGYLYMIFLVMAFLLSRRARWPIGFTLVTLICGTVPILSFWAEHRATGHVLREHAVPAGTPAAVNG